LFVPFAPDSTSGASRLAQISDKIVKIGVFFEKFRQAKEAFRSRRRPSIVIIVTTVKVSEKILENFSDLLKFNFQKTASPFFTVKIKRIRRLYRVFSIIFRIKETKNFYTKRRQKSPNATKKRTRSQKRVRSR